MASLMPNLDFDDFFRVDPPSVSLPGLAMQQQQHVQEQPFDITAHIPFSTFLENPRVASAQEFPWTSGPGFAAATVEQTPAVSGVGNLAQNYVSHHYGIIPQPIVTAADQKPFLGATLTNSTSFPLQSDRSVQPYNFSSAGPTFLQGARSSSTGTGSSSPEIQGSTGTVRKRRSLSSGGISKEKLEERRRKNRESSSRCYYNRKKQIERIERVLDEQRRSAINLYAKELELRNENARLKKELVMLNIRIPATMLTTTRAEPFSRPPVTHIQLRR